MGEQIKIKKWNIEKGWGIWHEKENRFLRHYSTDSLAIWKDKKEAEKRKGKNTKVIRVEITCRKNK